MIDIDIPSVCVCVWLTAKLIYKKKSYHHHHHHVVIVHQILYHPQLMRNTHTHTEKESIDLIINSIYTFSSEKKTRLSTIIYDNDDVVSSLYEIEFLVTEEKN